MNAKFDYIKDQLKQIKKDSMYRQLRPVKVANSHIIINNKKMINLCSNDYLGLGSIYRNNTNPKKKECNVSGYNQMQSSSRLVSGNDPSYKKIEAKLAKHKSQQAALIFPTGYMANIGVITAIAKRGDTIYSDELNHASIIEACRLSGAKIAIYKHNDTVDLERKIQKDGNNSKNKFVVTEGIFSMDGDFANLSQITEIAEKNGMITILDDAHADFVVGVKGKGSAAMSSVAAAPAVSTTTTTNTRAVQPSQKLLKKVDVYTSSLSKGLGSFGGYIASQSTVVDLCINKSKSFIYTSALPNVLVEHALQRLYMNHHTQRKKLQENTRDLIKGLKSVGYGNSITSNTHIIPIIIGDEKTAMKFGHHLTTNRVFAQPIRYPTVAKNKARIRVSVTAWLTDVQIQQAITAFEKAGKKFGII